MGTTLLFVKKKFSDAIRNGSKTFEIRCGSKYATIKPGAELSINGRYRVTVTAVDTHATQGDICTAMPDWASAIVECYANTPGPYYVFHFKPPPKDVPRPRAP